MEAAVELCRLAAKNRVDDLLVWQLAGVDLNACDYDKRTPLHVVSFAREILISLHTSLLASVILLPSCYYCISSLLQTTTPMRIGLMFPLIVTKYKVRIFFLFFFLVISISLSSRLLSTGSHYFLLNLSRRLTDI